MAGEIFEQNYYKENPRAGKRLRVSAIFLYIIHIVGAGGLLYPATTGIFQSLTPLNLLISSILLFSFHHYWLREFWAFLFITFLVGYFVEVLGVKYGFIFGEYSYGNTLGVKLWNVPVLMGLNWVLLIYVTGVISETIRSHYAIKAMVGASLMVLMDFVMEPVAVRYDFWYWENDVVPVQNYIAWGVIAFILLLIFYKLHFIKRNRLAWHLYIAQLLFFVALFYFDS